MSRIYLVIAALFVLAGLVASFFAPTENMGTSEAFYAHLILIAPPLFVGTVISALAMIIGRLDQILAKSGRAQAPQKFEFAQEEKQKEDFGSLFAEKLRADQAVDETPFVFEEEAIETVAPPAVSTPANNDWHAPTVDEYLEKGNEEQAPPSAQLAREGTFAGRNYRMYEDGSLEIDTDQSTIRFDSLEEFRSFVSSAANG